MMKYLKYYLITLGVILIDQFTKLLVFASMYRGEEIPLIGDWLKIHYTTNPGMAFGLEVGPKLALTLFRLVAMGAIGYYLYRLIKKQQHWGLLVCIALILGGAIGNVVDSTFYGVYLDGNIQNPEVASTPWFHGEVIDMIYFDIWEGKLPEWLPVFGGQHFSVWPIFNIADASIFVGVAVILMLQRKFFKDEEELPEEKNSDVKSAEKISSTNE